MQFEGKRRGECRVDRRVIYLMRSAVDPQVRVWVFFPDEQYRKVSIMPGKRDGLMQILFE